MAKFEINDFEGGFKTEVTAQGIVEAMADYLPWPSVDVTVKWSLSKCFFEVVDNQTDFYYEVKLT